MYISSYQRYVSYTRNNNDLPTVDNEDQYAFRNNLVKTHLVLAMNSVFRLNCYEHLACSVSSWFLMVQPLDNISMTLLIPHVLLNCGNI